MKQPFSFRIIHCKLNPKDKGKLQRSRISQQLKKWRTKMTK